MCNHAPKRKALRNRKTQQFTKKTQELDLGAEQYQINVVKLMPAEQISKRKK
jgi:hypothetical protein